MDPHEGKQVCKQMKQYETMFKELIDMVFDLVGPVVDIPEELDEETDDETDDDEDGPPQPAKSKTNDTKDSPQARLEEWRSVMLDFLILTRRQEDHLKKVRNDWNTLTVYEKETLIQAEELLVQCKEQLDSLILACDCHLNKLFWPDVEDPTEEG